MQRSLVVKWLVGPWISVHQKTTICLLVYFNYLWQSEQNSRTLVYNPRRQGFQLEMPVESKRSKTESLWHLEKFVCVCVVDTGLMSGRDVEKLIFPLPSGLFRLLYFLDMILFGKTTSFSNSVLLPWLYSNVSEEIKIFQHVRGCEEEKVPDLEMLRDIWTWRYEG